MAKVDHSKIVDDILSDIEYLDSMGLGAEEMWESINLNNYSMYATEQDKIKAFNKAGYEVSL